MVTKNKFTRDEKALVSKVTASKNLKNSIKKAVDLIGGFKRVISKDDKVIVKPNFNSDDPFPGSSDPEFVKATVNLLYDADASKIIIIESSGLPWLPTKRVLEKMGMIKAAEECNAELRILDDGPWVDVEINGKYWKKVSIAKDAFEDGAKLVWLPCMKTHRGARFTLSLKLIVGLQKISQRTSLHSMHLEEKIAELNLALCPDLIIMDGRKCFVTGGPDIGLVKEPNVILASGDRIAIDVEALKILKSYQANNRLDMPIWQLLQIRHAVELGVGVKSEDQIMLISG